MSACAAGRRASCRSWRSATGSRWRPGSCSRMTTRPPSPGRRPTLPTSRARGCPRTTPTSRRSAPTARAGSSCSRSRRRGPSSIDPAARRVVASVELEIPGHDDLARDWADPAGSRARSRASCRPATCSWPKRRTRRRSSSSGLPARPRSAWRGEAPCLPGPTGRSSPATTGTSLSRPGGPTSRSARHALTSAISRSALTATSTCSATSPTRSPGSRTFRRRAARSRRQRRGGSAPCTASPRAWPSPRTVAPWSPSTRARPATTWSSSSRRSRPLTPSRPVGLDGRFVGPA